MYGEKYDEKNTLYKKIKAYNLRGIRTSDIK